MNFYEHVNVLHCCYLCDGLCLKGAFVANENLLQTVRIRNSVTLLEDPIADFESPGSHVMGLFCTMSSVDEAIIKKIT